ncbi:MAG: hypothetical protein BJ554DRAFT_3464 [Olpidium bornovanus]|uniref:Uncharacterized protein n=1 Tax=Olpidium bornovanus TaxID=278681 RepID=A0A8H8DFT2_9FUNG|nr:MAG: hypothetical protein BJ554DRAFT_3464 [Olpidium bornovanus]
MPDRVYFHGIWMPYFAVAISLLPFQLNETIKSARKAVKSPTRFSVLLLAQNVFAILLTAGQCVLLTEEYYPMPGNLLVNYSLGPSMLLHSALLLQWFGLFRVVHQHRSEGCCYRHRPRALPALLAELLAIRGVGKKLSTRRPFLDSGVDDVRNAGLGVVGDRHRSRHVHCHPPVSGKVAPAVRPVQPGKPGEAAADLVRQAERDALRGAREAGQAGAARRRRPGEDDAHRRVPGGHGPPGPRRHGVFPLRARLRRDNVHRLPLHFHEHVLRPRDRNGSAGLERERERNLGPPRAPERNRQPGCAINSSQNAEKPLFHGFKKRKRKLLLERFNFLQSSRDISHRRRNRRQKL